MADWTCNDEAKVSKTITSQSIKLAVKATKGVPCNFRATSPLTSTLARICLWLYNKLTSELIWKWWSKSLSFQWPDYLVLAIVLVASAAKGFYFAFTGGRQRTTKEYLFADRTVHWLPVSCSLLARYVISILLFWITVFFPGIDAFMLHFRSENNYWIYIEK